MPVETYNFDTFRRDMLRREMHFQSGPNSGEFAPDFHLPLVGGGHFCLSEWRGRKPVLLQFGSITCPMTAGSRGGLMKLFRDFGTRVQFLTVYVREAHPGENYPHHTSLEQKMRHAQDWVTQDKIPWGVAVDSIDGATHRVYDEMPNSVYLIDRTGRVAFRALWAGQEGLLRRSLEELLGRESAGEDPVVLGEKENHVVPFIHGAAEFERSVGRGGSKAKEDFRREAGEVRYNFERLMSKFEPVINPGNQDIEGEVP
jgi:hypothetical protein